MDKNELKVIIKINERSGKWVFYNENGKVYEYKEY